jgi:hypothetical protein
MVWGYADHIFDYFRRHPVPLSFLTFPGEHNNQAFAGKLEELLVGRDDVREVRTDRAGKVQRQIKWIVDVRYSELFETCNDAVNVVSGTKGLSINN